MNNPRPRYELRRSGHAQWQVRDSSFPADDSRHLIAHIYEVDEFEYDVVWTGPTELRAEYGSPDDVLADIRRSTMLQSHRGADRPVPIAHHEPVYGPPAKAS